MEIGNHKNRIREIGRLQFSDTSVVYGKQCITIDKDTGERELFYLPNDKNFELLDNAVDIVIPEEYKIRA